MPQLVGQEVRVDLMLTIVIDTREQLPWSFPEADEVVYAALPAGDYSFRGGETEVVIERKRVQELFGCFGRERERFRREFERLASYRYAAVVIEGSMADVLRGPVRGEVLPKVVICSLASWSVKYGIHIWFAGGRREAARLCWHLLRFACSGLDAANANATVKRRGGNGAKAKAREAG